MEVMLVRVPACASLLLDMCVCVCICVRTLAAKGLDVLEQAYSHGARVVDHLFLAADLLLEGVVARAPLPFLETELGQAAST